MHMDQMKILVLKSKITKILKREKNTGLSQKHNRDGRRVSKPENELIENIHSVQKKE